MNKDEGAYKPSRIFDQLYKKKRVSFSGAYDTS